MASMSQSMLAHGRTLAASDHLRSSSRCINGASLKELRRTRLFFAGRSRDFSLGAWLRKGKKYEYPWPKDPDPNVEGGVLTHLSDFKPLKEKPKPVILDFEKPLMNIKKTMDDAKKKANDKGEDSSTLIAELEEKYREENAVVKERSVSVILLAGGKGKRMGASMPKQYLPLLGQPIALYSLYTFSQMIEVKEIVVVCDPSYRDIFEDTKKKINVVFKFSEPGKERQDSVYSGLQAVDSTSELVCIHDSARPLVLSRDVEKVLKDGWLHGAAVLGVPVKATIKEASGDQFVVKTLDRKTLWEMQTPQVIRPALLKEGFDLVKRKGVEVTDDVSIVEHLKHPVYITQGSYTNIKITTPDDLLVAERILNSS